MIGGVTCATSSRWAPWKALAGSFGYVHAGADPIKGTFFCYVEREGTLSTWWCCPGAGHPDILDNFSPSFIYLAAALTATTDRSRKKNHDPNKIMIRPHKWFDFDFQVFSINCIFVREKHTKRPWFFLPIFPLTWSLRIFLTNHPFTCAFCRIFAKSEKW